MTDTTKPFTKSMTLYRFHDAFGGWSFVDLQTWQVSGNLRTFHDYANGVLVKRGKFCVCEPGLPCDYHNATCVVCSPRCKGHPA